MVLAVEVMMTLSDYLGVMALMGIVGLMILVMAFWFVCRVVECMIDRWTDWKIRRIEKRLKEKGIAQ